MSRAPPCLPHGLSAEDNGSQSTMPARVKSLIGEYLGQSSVFVGKKTKGGVGWRKSRPTVVIGQRQRGGGTRGHTEGEENEPRPRQEGRRGGWNTRPLPHSGITRL
jgi:hypothetical protein